MTAVKHADANTNDLVVELFLVRHGETDFNRRGLVLGQVDAPLTDAGRHQARLLAASSFWKSHVVEKSEAPLVVYSSDLVRAHETAQILFSSQQQHSLPKQMPNTGDDTSSSSTNTINQRYQEDGDDLTHTDSIPIYLDTRIRELGKGAREGLPRTLTYEEAVARQKDLHPHRTDFGNKETHHEGWERAKDFLNSILTKAVDECRQNQSTQDSLHTEIATAVEKLAVGRIPREKTSESPSKTSRRTIRVVAVSHSGFLRVLLENLLGKSNLRNHPQARVEENTGLFLIPNTSVTRLEFRLSPDDGDSSRGLIQTIIKESPERMKIVELTWCDHLDGHGDEALMNGE